MVADLYPDSAGAHAEFVIQCQSLNRGATNWGQSEDLCALLVSGKVLCPVLAPRIKEGM